VEFTLAESLRHPPDAVQEAFLDADFLALTARLPKVGGAELIELTREARTARLRVRYRFTAPLSRAVTSVVDPAKLTWVDDATFDLDAFRADHVLVPDYYPDRLASSYSSTLTPEGAGARWTVQGRLEVRAPLVGGRVARVIVDGLRETFVAQSALLDQFLTRP